MDKNVLKGVVDTHIHTGPEPYRQRKFNDDELAKDACAVGARAIVIKSHVFETASRANLMNGRYPELKTFGGITLNEWMGGFNVKAVDAMFQVGGKFVWLPTLSSRYERELLGGQGGISCVDEQENVVPKLVDILKLIAEADGILATGHVSYLEKKRVIEKAKEVGVNRIIINHPELYRTRLTIEQQKELLPYGVYFERNYCGTERPLNPRWIKHMPLALENIRVLGAESTILGTDVGLMNSPIWSEAYLECMNYLADHGISQSELDLMTKVNGAKILGLENDGLQEKREKRGKRR